MIESLQATRLRVNFKQSFAHASASRDATQTIWVVARGRGCAGYGDGCPREYVTGESLASAEAFIARHVAGWQRDIGSMEDLAAWVRAHRADIDANPAAWAAVELALIDLMGRIAGKPAEALLGLPALAGRFRYTAVIGDGPPAAFDAQLARYRQAGFADFKIKLSGDAERDAAKVRSLKAAGLAPGAVRADANNLWRHADDALAALRAMDFAFHALEEPLPSGDYAGMARLARELGCRIVLDESLSRLAQLAALGDATAWVANVRVSKMGGMLRSLELLGPASGKGLRVIVGAHVGETSVLARCGLALAAAAGPALLAQEGAFGTHLLERDVAEPAVMFGPGGMLDATPLGAGPGWGLRMLPEQPSTRV